MWHMRIPTHVMLHMRIPTHVMWHTRIPTYVMWHMRIPTYVMWHTKILVHVMWHMRILMHMMWHMRIAHSIIIQCLLPYTHNYMYAMIMELPMCLNCRFHHHPVSVSLYTQLHVCGDYGAPNVPKLLGMSS